MNTIEHRHHPAPAPSGSAGLNRFEAFRYYSSMQQRYMSIHMALDLPSSSSQRDCKSERTRNPQVLPFYVTEMREYPHCPKSTQQ